MHAGVGTFPKRRGRPAGRPVLEKHRPFLVWVRRRVDQSKGGEGEEQQQQQQQQQQEEEGGGGGGGGRGKKKNNNVADRVTRRSISSDL